MPTYRTRHLEALVDLEHGSNVIPRGQRFFATEQDAEYFNRKRPRVRDVPEVKAPEVPPVRRGRPPNKPPSDADIVTQAFIGATALTAATTHATMAAAPEFGEPSHLAE